VISFGVPSKVYFILSRTYYLIWFVLKFKRFPIYKNSRFVDYLYARKVSGILLEEFRRNLTDKFLAKQYIQSKLGDRYTIETLAILSTIDEIKNFMSPVFPIFVKPTHSSGRQLLLHSQEEFDKNMDIMASWLSHDYFLDTLEENYFDLDKRIIIEPVITDEYHLEGSAHCIDGRIKVISLIDRFDAEKRRESFNSKLVPINGSIGNGYKKINLTYINRLQELLNSIESLVKDIDYLRVDFYLSNNFFLIGELTNLPAGGGVVFFPKSSEKTFNKILKKN